MVRTYVVVSYRQSCFHSVIYSSQCLVFTTSDAILVKCTRGDPKKNRTGFGELFLIVVECSPAR